MHQISEHDMALTTGIGLEADRRADRMGGPLVGSALLHVLVLLLAIFGLPWPASPVERVIPIDLVFLGEKTASPAAETQAKLPQERAPELAELTPEQAVPAETAPPPQAAPRRAEERAAPELPPPTKLEPKPKAPRPVKSSKPDRQPTARLERQPLPADDLSVRLERLARLRQPAPTMPPSPRPQKGRGASDVTATAADAAPALDASYGVKDFIRAQVERRWNPDGKKLKGGDWVAAIHVVLRPDGSVERAEIVDDPRHHGESAYRAFAQSARNAVLLSSPLTVPPGEYDLAKDIVLDFHARQVAQ